jgi:hypothetical protein
MAVPFDHLPRHRQLIWFLETALDCLVEAVEIDATLGVLPHWARGQVRAMAEELQDLLAHVAWESPALSPLRDDEVLNEDEGVGGSCP